MAAVVHTMIAAPPVDPMVTSNSTFCSDERFADVLLHGVIPPQDCNSQIYPRLNTFLWAVERRARGHRNVLCIH